MSVYITDPYIADQLHVQHRHGVSWLQAPAPRRLHRCSAQTRAIDGFLLVERCACGATRYNMRRWFDRNSKRRSVSSPPHPNA